MEVVMGRKRARQGREKVVIGMNKYRGGMTVATTSSLLIASMTMMSFDGFLPSKMVIFVI